MYQVGKVHQVAKEMKRLRLAILGVSETRWTGAAKVHVTTGETVLYSGLASPTCPLSGPSRSQAEGQTNEVLEKDNSAGI